MSKRNIETAKKYFTQMWTGDLSAAEKFLSPNARMIGGDGKLRAEGYINFQRVASGYAEAFADIEVIIDETLAKGDKVILFWQFSGTHQNQFKGLPATGNRVSTTGVHTFKFEGEKIIEERYVYDSHGFYEQIQEIEKVTLSETQLEDANITEYVNDIRYISSLISRNSQPEKIQEQWAIFVERNKNQLASKDINALVQYALREAYLETNEDLQFYANKIKYFNELKKSIRNRLQQTKEEFDYLKKGLEDRLQSIGDDAQLANIDLQNALQKQQQSLQTISNTSKMLHDTAMAVIRKIG